MISKIVSKYNIIKTRPQESTVKIIFTPEQITHITESYGKTETLLSLSKIYDCSRKVIKNLLRENNIVLLEKTISKELQQRNKYLNTITPNIINDYLDDISSHEIKRKYNMSFEKVIEILIKNNIQLKPKGFYTKITFSKQITDEIINKYINGETITDLAPEYKVSYPTLLNVLIENGIHLRGRNSSFLCRTSHRSSCGISGTYKNHTFRSMNELSFMINYLEIKNIQFTSDRENEGIPYFDSVQNKQRTYFPDFITNKYIFENKPKKLWNWPEVLDKAVAAKEYCKIHNLKYQIIDYPVILDPILDKYFNEEIQFDKKGLEKFTRIYKKFLN